MGGTISAAFVLGAGLGTRLRPLTAERPKPLVPIFHKALITFAFDHLHAAGVRNFIVNTHHCPEAYESLLGVRNGRTHYRGAPVHVRYEPVLLDTGGGIKNVQDLLGKEPFLVHNGDILADLRLDRLIQRHVEEDNIATLALRSAGGPLQVQLDESTGRITDIRGMLGGGQGPKFLFTGIYVLSPEIFRHIPAGEAVSIVPVLLELIRSRKRVGGMVLDEGLWFDLGTRNAYLEAHRIFSEGRQSLSYTLDRLWPQPVHPDAVLAEGVELHGVCAIGPHTTVGPGAVLTNSIVWENAEIASRAHLEACIVRNERRVEGIHRDTDI